MKLSKEFKGLTKNHFGVIQYPADDVRRLFVLAGAMAILERATLPAIADLTGTPAEAIVGDVEILCQQFGMRIHTMGNVYRIASWGDVLNQEGVIRRMKEPD